MPSKCFGVKIWTAFPPSLKKKISRVECPHKCPGKMWTASLHFCKKKTESSACKIFGVGQHFPLFSLKKKISRIEYPQKYPGQKILDSISPLSNNQGRVPAKLFGAKIWTAFPPLKKKNLQSRMPTKISWINFGQHFPLKLQIPRVECLQNFGAKIWTTFPPLYSPL